MKKRKYTSWAALLILIVAASTARASQPGAGNDLPAAIADEIRCEEYRFTTQEDGATSAPNRAQDLRSRFSEHGLYLASRTRGEAGWSLSLRLSGFGREGAVSPVADVRPEVGKNQVTYQRPGIVEWYLNDSRGLEQGFDVLVQPPGVKDGGKLVVAMPVTTGLRGTVQEDGRSVLFHSSTGEVALSYGGLKVTDAGGRDLEADLTLENQVLQIRIDDKNASYPIRVDPLMTSPSWNTSGTEPFNLLGLSVASAGNVNGDAYADLIVGVPNYDGGFDNQGRAFVFHGSASGPIGSTWNPVHVGQVGAYFGYSVASAGNVNGDAYDDVIVGAPWEDNGQLDEGRVYIYHGSASGLSNTASKILERDKAGALFGFSVASAGRINSNDTYGDIIVGAPNFKEGTNQDNEGKAWVWKGSASGIPTTPHWGAELNQKNAYLGYSVASAGDVAGDGADEVLIAAIGVGTVYLWEGGTTGLGSNGTINNFDWKATTDQANSNFGESVAPAGDVNNDGYDDIIIGAPHYGITPGQVQEGSVFVWYGGSTGLGLNGTPSNASWRAETNLNVTTYGVPEFGHSVASAGDVNNDGFGDIVVGSFTFSSDGQTQKGAAFLWEGSSSGLGPSGTPQNAQALIGESNIAWFGYSVAGAGDVDNDGYDDVIVGAPKQDTIAGTDGGRAYLYRGQMTPCQVMCQTTWCKFEDFLCTASVVCPGNCCAYTDCVATACTADPTCPPHACPGTCP